MPAMLAERKLLLGTGLNYHLLEWDDAKADHTIVLVHGFLDNCWGFRRLAEAGLHERFHVIAPDLRGHGDSDWIGPGGYYHFSDYVADLHELIQKIARGTLSL